MYYFVVSLLSSHLTSYCKSADTDRLTTTYFSFLFPRRSKLSTSLSTRSSFPAASSPFRAMTKHSSMRRSSAFSTTSRRWLTTLDAPRKRVTTHATTWSTAKAESAVQNAVLAPTVPAKTGEGCDLISYVMNSLLQYLG